MSAQAEAHAAFLEARRSYIGGTDIAGIVKLSPWASPLSVYLDKIGDSHPTEDTLPMRRGLVLERFIADEFEREHSNLVCYHPAPIVRTDWGFPAGASIDRMIAERERPRTPVAVLETKTAFSVWGRRQWDVTADDLPDHYWTQVQWYLAVSGLPIAYGAADVGDDHLRIVPIEADAAVQKNLIERGREFWQWHVEGRRPPEPIGGEADARALLDMWTETVPDPPLDLRDDEQAGETLAAYLTAKAEAEQAAGSADALKQRLQALMGEHEAAILAGHRLSWKPQKRNSIDSKALRAAHPEIAGEFSRETTSRPFTVKEITDGNH